MTVTLNLKPQVEAEIAQKAAAEGMRVSDYLEKMIKERVIPDPTTDRPQAQLEKNQAAVAVLRQWREEDKTDYPEEVARRQAELDEFKEGINENHTSDRLIYP